jgi:TatD DNase family protein
VFKAPADAFFPLPDIAVNLTDDMFTGLYRGKQLHESDLDQVVQRAKDRGVERMIITGTSLKESRQAIELAKRYSPYAILTCLRTKILG